MFIELPAIVVDTCRRLNAAKCLVCIAIEYRSIPRLLLDQGATKVYRLVILVPCLRKGCEDTTYRREKYYLSLDGMNPGLYDDEEAFGTSPGVVNQNVLDRRRDTISSGWDEKEAERRRELTVTDMLSCLESH